MNIKEISIKDYNYELPDERIAKFPKAEREEFERIISIAADAAAAWVNEPLDKVMNKYNIKEKKK